MNVKTCLGEVNPVEVITIGTNMIGVYKIENQINHKVYIGQSIDIHKRWYEHKSAAFNPNEPRYEAQISYALRKYGLENFKFEVVTTLTPELYSREALNELEKYYIALYDSFRYGYNATPGGEYGVSQKGEINGHAKMTTDDVFHIRELYAAHVPHGEAYTLYQDKISWSGFTKIWCGYNWKHVHMDVYTSEHKAFHSSVARTVPRDRQKNAKLSSVEVRVIQQRKLAGEGIKTVYQDYKHKITFGGFEHIWYQR